jgi:hypothetical protein
MDQEKSSFVAQTDAVVHVYRSSGRVYAIRDWEEARSPLRPHCLYVVATDGSFPWPAAVRPTEWLRCRPIRIAGRAENRWRAA